MPKQHKGTLRNVAASHRHYHGSCHEQNGGAPTDYSSRCPRTIILGSANDPISRIYTHNLPRLLHRLDHIIHPSPIGGRKPDKPLQLGICEGKGHILNLLSASSRGRPSWHRTHIHEEVKFAVALLRDDLICRSNQPRSCLERVDLLQREIRLKEGIFPE